MKLENAEKSIRAQKLLAGESIGTIEELWPGLAACYSDKLLRISQRLFFQAAAGRHLPASAELLSVELVLREHRIILDAVSQSLDIRGGRAGRPSSTQNEWEIIIKIAQDPDDVLACAMHDGGLMAYGTMNGDKLRRSISLCVAQ